jgi:hypothetical protein
MRPIRLNKHHYAMMSMLLKRLTSEDVVVNGRKAGAGEVYLIRILTPPPNGLALKKTKTNKQHQKKGTTLLCLVSLSSTLNNLD